MQLCETEFLSYTLKSGTLSLRNCVRPRHFARPSTLSLRNCAGDPGKSRLVKMRQSSIGSLRRVVCGSRASPAGRTAFGSSRPDQRSETFGWRTRRRWCVPNSTALGVYASQVLKVGAAAQPRAALPTLCSTSHAIFCYDSARDTQFLMCIETIFGTLANFRGIM